MNEVQKHYLKWAGFNDYEIEEVEAEIKNGEEPLVFEDNQFYSWESGYNKANEWHYVKDGNPKNEDDILCLISKDEVVVGYYHSAKKRYITIDGQDIYNIIAWKEIVLPKESE